VKKFVLFTLLIALAGCIRVHNQITGPEADYQHASLLAQEKKYGEAITTYNKIAADSPRSEIGADALFEAAYLSVLHDNPHKDYGQAIAGFDEFLKQYPDHPKARDALSWRGLLKSVLDSRKENEHLKQSIEELKKLDIRHEERRRK
jgi:outer membrane protein assembly factor BamD (BamD/ComL family)